MAPSGGCIPGVRWTLAPAALPRRVTIDEIQRAPELLPAIKLSVDMDRHPGRFVLTGSANRCCCPR